MILNQKYGREQSALKQHLETNHQKKTMVRHLDLILFVFAQHDQYLSPEKAFQHVLRLKKILQKQNRTIFPLTHQGFVRQIGLACKKGWLERNGTSLRITARGRAIIGL